MAMHEIGFLIIGGTFQCWFWQGADNPCPNSEKISPAGIQRQAASQYINKEIYYEESGFSVFDRKGESFEIHKLTGEKTWLELKEINQQVDNSIAKTASETEKATSRWRYVAIEDIFKNGMIGRDDVGPLELYQDDLKTPVNILSGVLKNIREKRRAVIFKQKNLQLPTGYIVTSTACTYTKVGTQMQGTCAPPAKAFVYSKPDKQSTKILEASFLFGHFKGFPIHMGLASPTNSEKLFVYEEQGDWVRMRLEVLEDAKRDVWVHKKDIPYLYTRLKDEERIPALKELLNSRGENTFESIEAELNEEPVFDIESAGVTKWNEGTLWVKINVRDEDKCSGAEHKVLATGWMPYVDPKTKKKKIGWLSRGC